LDLDDVHKRLFFLANKETSFWPRADVDNALDMAQMWKYNDASPLYAINQEAKDDLTPFVFTYPFTTGNTPNGLITFTAGDYLHFLSLFVQWQDAGTGNIRTQDAIEINEDELGARLNSQLKPVTIYTPIITYPTKGSVQLWPKVPNTGYAFYLRQPAKPNYVYTQVGRVITYNQAGSTQLEWNNAAINQIIMKALEILSKNMDDMQGVQYAAAKDQQKT
jgi:hypothetical protein